MKRKGKNINYSKRYRLRLVQYGQDVSLIMFPLYNSCLRFVILTKPSCFLRRYNVRLYVQYQQAYVPSYPVTYFPHLHQSRNHEIRSYYCAATRHYFFQCSYLYSKQYGIPERLWANLILPTAFLQPNPGSASAKDMLKMTD